MRMAPGALGYHAKVDRDGFRELVKAVVEQGDTLTRAQAHSLLGFVLADTTMAADPAATLPAEVSLAALLAVMARRGETAEELCGFAQAMRAASTTIPLNETERGRVVDTCGTGGDGLDTLNISTAAGLVAAGAGAWIAKHGNRAITSRCGSADVLEALGVPIALTPDAGARCLRETHFLFMLASALHPAMRRLGPMRRALPFRTILNLAGPLTNPAGAQAQVVGVFAQERIVIVAEALRMLGTRHALVVHGEVAPREREQRSLNPPIQPARQGLDELTVTGPSSYARVQGNLLQTGVLAPEELGMARVDIAALAGGATAAENAGLIEAILQGIDRGPRRDIVLLNAGAALEVAGVAQDLPEGIARASEAVDGGAALDVLTKLRGFRA
jgi:anthranilate phosphoribosyltransferase